MIRNFDEMLAKARELSGKRVLVAGAQTPSAIEASILAKEEGFAESTLIGDKEAIQTIIKEKFPKYIDAFEIIDTGADLKKACAETVRLAKEGKGDIILKGKADSALILKAALDKENGVRISEVISDVFAYEHPERVILMTDGGINLLPELKEKVAIINNAVKVAHAFECPNPKVALLAAVEKVNPKMPCTVDAAIISKMNARGQIKGCVVDGPLAFDNAIDEEAARIKGIESEVAGKADILIVPNIEAGNIFGKLLTYYCNYRIAHIVMGTKVPILIPSRADTGETKMLCIAMAVLATK